MRELMEFRVVGGYTEGLVWMLLASRETTVLIVLQCGAGIFFKQEKWMMLRANLFYFGFTAEQFYASPSLTSEDLLFKDSVRIWEEKGDSRCEGGTGLVMSVCLYSFQPKILLNNHLAVSGSGLDRLAIQTQRQRMLQPVPGWLATVFKTRR